MTPRSTFVWAFLLALCMFSAGGALEAAIYMNTFPTDIVVGEGEPVNVPVFIVGGQLTNQPVELFIWTSDVNGMTQKSLSAAGWTPTTDPATLAPVLSLDRMIEYVFFEWTAFPTSLGMESFNMHICLDGNIDGQLSEGADCSTRLIIVDHTSPPQDCAGVVLSPTSISASVAPTKSTSLSVGVRNSCGGTISASSYSAVASTSWIEVAKQDGSMSITLKAPLTKDTLTGFIDVSAGGSTTRLQVTMVVKLPDVDIGGGGGTCTPSSISVWPASITAAAGETKATSVSVTNNCGNAISFTASSLTSWLSVPASGSGTLTVTANTSGMSSGAYEGAVSVSSGGLPAVTVPVYLSVSGPCVPSSAVVNPLSITQTIQPGATANMVTVAVKDNCGTSIPFTVDTVTPAGGFISAPTAGASGTGTFNVSFTTASLAQGSYTGSIMVTPSIGNPQDVSVAITVADSPPPPPANIQDLAAPHVIHYFDLPGNGVAIFRFFATLSSASNYPLQVSMLNQYYQNGTNSDLLVKYAGTNCEAGPPTMDDYTAAKQYFQTYGNSLWDATRQIWNPARIRDDLYYSMSRNSMEVIEIYGIPDNPHGCYYIMTVNALPVSEVGLRLSIMDADMLVR